MRTLATEYRKNSYDFKQVSREGGIAIYEQIDPDTKKIVAYEVFEVQKNASRVIAGVTIEAGESTPSNEQWGKSGYTVWTLAEAAKKVDILRNRHLHPENIA